MEEKSIIILIFPFSISSKHALASIVPDKHGGAKFSTPSLTKSFGLAKHHSLSNGFASNKNFTMPLPATSSTSTHILFTPKTKHPFLLLIYCAYLAK